jgi:HEAT repeat protein
MAEEARYRGVRRLTGVPAEVPAALTLLADPSWRVRKATVLMLRRFGQASELASALVAGLASTDNAGLRNACAEALVTAGAAAVAELTAALATPDPGHRKFIVEVLGAIGGDAARGALTASLRDEDANVRAAAAEALGRIGDEEAVRPLIALATAPTTTLMERVYLFDALAASGFRVDLDLLEPWLGEPTLQRQVLVLLGRCGEERAVAPLLAGLEAPTRSTRAVAARALGDLIEGTGDGRRRRIGSHLSPGSAGRRVALELLEHEEDAVVDAAVRLLGATADARLSPQLLAACACRPVVETGTRVVLSMGRAAVAPLLDAFDAVGTEARVLFLEVVEVLGDRSVVPALLEIASGPDNRACEAALRVVGRLAGDEAVDRLMDLVRKREAETARAAAMALADVGARAASVVAEKVRATFLGGDQRPEWLLVLGVLGRTDDLDILEASTHHREPEVRCAAVEAARAVGPEFPENTLTLLLTDESSRVRAAAARALASYHSDRTRDALLAVARDRDPWVVAEAVRSLGQFRGEDVESVLADASASSVSPIAISALRALFRLNPAGLDTLIERALTHADPEVVRDGVEATMRLPAATARRLLQAALASRYWTVRAAAARALLNRRLALPAAEVHDLLMVEDEPLASEALEQLLALTDRDSTTVCEVPA